MIGKWEFLSEVCLANRAMPIPVPGYFAPILKTSERNLIMIILRLSNE